MPLMPEVDEFDPTTDLKAYREEAEVRENERREQVAGRLHDARRDAIGSLNQAVIDIANMSDDDVVGTERAAEFLEYVAEQLKKRGDTPMFTDQASTPQRVQVNAVTTGSGVSDSQSQTRELEAANARAEDLQQQVVDNEHVAEQLRDSARRASNLQGELTIAQRRLERSEETKGQLRDELGEAHTKVTELETTVDELTVKNEQLRWDNQSLEQQLADEKQAHGRTKDELGTLRTQPTDTPPPADQPEPPASASSGASDEPEPGNDESHTGIIDTNGGLAAGETPPPRTHKEELERRRGIRGMIDKGRSIAPGHSNPRNDTNGSEK